MKTNTYKEPEDIWESVVETKDWTNDFEEVVSRKESVNVKEDNENNTVVQVAVI